MLYIVLLLITLTSGVGHISSDNLVKQGCLLDTFTKPAHCCRPCMPWLSTSAVEQGILQAQGSVLVRCAHDGYPHLLLGSYEDVCMPLHRAVHGFTRRKSC